MAQIVIVDAGPLIALAKVDRLDIFQLLFGQIVIPGAVQQECLFKSDPDSLRIQQAIHSGIVKTKKLSMGIHCPYLAALAKVKKKRFI